MRKIAPLIATTASYLAYAVPALAVDNIIDPGQNQGSFGNLFSFSAANFGNLLGSILQLIFVIGIIAALFYLIYGGIKWITSEGDKSSVEAARNHIVAAVVGLIIIFLAYFAISVLVQVFTGKSLGDLRLPTLGTGK